MITSQPITQITQEHLDWWDKLPELWKKIFCVSIYHPEKMDIQVDYDKEYFGEAGEEYDEADEFTYSYPYTELKNTTDLLHLFQVKKIAYEKTFLPPEEEAVTFIPPMHFFTQLECLDLRHNFLDDIKGLRGINSLKYLGLHESLYTKNIDVIGSLTGLMNMDISFNHFGGNLNSFVNLKNLVVARLSYNEMIVDISPLMHLTQLKILHLRGCPITDLTPLGNLKNLQELSIGYEDDNRERFEYPQLDWLKSQLPTTEIEAG